MWSTVVVLCISGCVLNVTGRKAPVRCEKCLFHSNGQSQCLKVDCICAPCPEDNVIFDGKTNVCFGNPMNLTGLNATYGSLRIIPDERGVYHFKAPPKTNPYMFLQFEEKIGVVQVLLDILSGPPANEWHITVGDDKSVGMLCHKKIEVIQDWRKKEAMFTCPCPLKGNTVKIEFQRRSDFDILNIWAKIKVFGFNEVA